MDELFDEVVTVVAALDEPAIGTREIRLCAKTGQLVEMEYVGWTDANNGHPGWLCLHDDTKAGMV